MIRLARPFRSMRSIRSLRSAASATALAAFVGLLLAACSGADGVGYGDAGTGCPSSPPTQGAACFLSNGTTCNYGTPGGPCGGGGLVAICSAGQWQFEATAFGGAPNESACPATIPEQGSPCSVGGCGDAAPSCNYGCDQGGPAVATCNGSTWEVARSNIACAVDGGPDADGGGASCRQQADCGPGDYCRAPGGAYLTGVALGQPCSSDDACAPGTGGPSCSGGACVCQSTQFSPRPQPGGQGSGYCMAPCATDADCAGSPLGALYGDGTGFVCGAGGHCVPKACAAPSDCPSDFDCTANQCVRRSCAADADCPASSACVDGACYAGPGACLPLPA